MIYLLPIIGLAVGIIVATYLPAMPMTYSKYLAIAILACLDSVMGGISSSLEKRFDMKIFISGFFSNAMLAAILTYMGEKLGLDIYMAAVIVFASRIFNNFAIIRRILLNKLKKEDNINSMKVDSANEK